MASLGVLSKEYREAALILLKKSLKINWNWVFLGLKKGGIFCFQD
jgi:hypothetical protein